MSEDKIIALPKLKILVARLKSKKKRIIFTNGCFDLIHAGHIKYLERAKALGDVLIVGINSDSSMRKIKGPKRPIVEQNDRARIIAGLGFVDYVSIFNEATPLKLIEAIGPDILVKGADWRSKKIIGTDLVKRYGGKTVVIPLVKGRSTSRLIRRIITRFDGTKNI